MDRVIVWQTGVLLATLIGQLMLPIEGAIAITFDPPRGDAPKETVGAGSRFLEDDSRGSGRFEKQATADDTSTVCTDRFGKFVPCPKLVAIAEDKEEQKRCRRPGDSGEDPPCKLTSLPEAQQEDPDLSDDGTPQRTQGSGTR